MTWDITGMAAVANIGASPQEIFAALCAGQESRKPLKAFDRDKYRAAYAYEIDDRPEGGGDIPRRATRWLTTVVRQAVADAGLGEDLSQVPVLVGTTMREQRSLELWWRDDADVALEDLHFGTALNAAFGAATTYTFANACSATLYALGMATDMIDLGLADTVVVVGTDAATESGFGTLDRVQNDIPDALRPFDATHKGMLMGEGAAAVVVQRAGTGSMPAHARVRGVSMNCDAHHAAAPDPDGITRAVLDAYRRAGVRAQDIDLVMLHGSGTPRNDATESGVLRRIFDGAGPGPRMTAIKAMTGHTLGGSGLLSLLMAVLAMKKGTVPPVLGLTDPIPEAMGLDLVQGSPVSGDLAIAQIDAFGFGGINAVAIVEAAAR
ncbi:MULTISPECIES: beta-ketoacyl synthase N-terminal-like domain-containing protein [unclassified Streptomyces]|uniref:beta-ketoacyl synthase N-terminal-like domain-containing protein n=1 Tax=unclassified Streptomyces TaxID=2593676 RepID=UPI002366F3F6|nr:MULTISPECIES: beta-ketoacyl synthase N-terminal-like domain-containing protein [unclassified Streptomyces]MDF3140985.1 beta-ketoacyl synthase N-terminal-like domain-containing protein [Streptomyces sp. T21Q-yed]WDF43622.1 beta-ketoacyl synthase N-terminal-like domain-containing protein [Streptomyces sp. T12]